jgi:hypothetical protein
MRLHMKIRYVLGLRKFTNLSIFLETPGQDISKNWLLISYYRMLITVMS